MEAEGESVEMEAGDSGRHRPGRAASLDQPRRHDHVPGIALGREAVGRHAAVSSNCKWSKSHTDRKAGLARLWTTLVE